MPSKATAKKKATKPVQKIRRSPSESSKNVIKSGDSFEFENPLEFFNLLVYVNKQCKPDERFKGRVLLLPVNLGELDWYGTNENLIYYTRHGNIETLRGMRPREFLAQFWEKKPRVNITTNVWVFDPYGSGPFPSRVKNIEDKEYIGVIQSTITAFRRGLQVIRKEHQKMKEGAAKDTPTWKLCSICNPIPDKSYGFWKGGNLESGGIPVNENLLEIVGEPFFKDDTSSRGWCIKRCPECGTCYKWDFDYEYLVNGTEDEINVVRLSDADAKEWVQRVYETIHASEEDFKKRVPPYLEILMTSTNPKALQDAAFFIEYAYNVQGHDIAFTIPALVRALAWHPHVPHPAPNTQCAGWWISCTLGHYAEKKLWQAEHLLRVMQTEKPTSVGDEFGQLLARTQKQVAEKKFF